jgi:hypothetical protein
MEAINRSLHLIAAISLAASVAGCGSLRIHSEVREKQGADAKAAWSKVDTGAVIAAERANLNQLLESELATQDKLALAIRDHTLRSIVDASSIEAGLFQRVDEQLTRLVGKDGPKKIAAALDVQGQRRTWQARLSDTQETWGGFGLGLPAPVCADFSVDATPARRAALAKAQAAVKTSPQAPPPQHRRKLGAQAALEDIQSKCENEPKADPFADFEGALGTARSRQLADQEAWAQSQKNTAARQTEYEAAAKAYAEALGDGTGTVSAHAQAAAARLGDAVEALAKAPEAQSRKFIAKERLDSLQAFVDAVTQAGTDGKLPEGASKAATAFVLFPKLADDARKSLTDAKAPLALPLLIQRNHEQLLLEAATREVAAREAQLRISGAVVETAFEQARQLALARREFDTVVALPEVNGKPVAAAFSSAPPTAKASLYRGAALYLDALNRLEARRYKLEYQYIAAVHELQLAYAEVNVKQWSSLIGATVDQVAAASAGGIKADSVVALLNTFGIFYIGHGVNK